MQKHIEKKFTSSKWAAILGLKFINLSGFPSKEYFEKVYVKKEDFLGYASNCKVEKPSSLSRREAVKMLKKLV